MKVVDTNSRGCQIDATNDLALLPYPNEYFDIITARSLYKRTTYMHADTHMAREDNLKNCVEECSRILVSGGRLEYIYFEDELRNCGPLMTEMQQFLWEIWCDVPTTDESVRGILEVILLSPVTIPSSRPAAHKQTNTDVDTDTDTATRIYICLPYQY